MVTFKQNILLVDLFIVDATMQCASFYVERIDLASKLRKANQNGGGVGHFQVKSLLTNLQNLTHQITLLAIILKVISGNFQIFDHFQAAAVPGM